MINSTAPAQSVVVSLSEPATVAEPPQTSADTMTTASDEANVFAARFSRMSDRAPRTPAELPAHLQSAAETAAEKTNEYREGNDANAVAKECSEHNEEGFSRSDAQKLLDAALAYSREREYAIYRP